MNYLNLLQQIDQIIKKLQTHTEVSMKLNSIMQMKTSQFPFGLYQAQSSQSRKILIKKRIFYKNQKQHELLQQKINILKNIYHKNAINFRQIQENMDGSMDVYYNYVPYSLQGFFDECDGEVIKEIHTQLIKLAIYLAKNCLLTSFNPSRCGVMMNADDKLQVKYYLPLKEIVVTNDVVMLERSVQLFTVQALHFLDSLTQFSEVNTNCGSRNLGNREREVQANINKGRKDSQKYIKSARKQRRFSNQSPFLQFPRRKLSIVSRQKSQFSAESHKLTNSSTVFQTIRSFSPQDIEAKKNQATFKFQLRAKEAHNIIERSKRANSRSRKALNVFGAIIKQMKEAREIKSKLEWLADGRVGHKIK